MSLLQFEHYLKCEVLRRDLPHECLSSPEMYVKYVAARVVRRKCEAHI